MCIRDSTEAASILNQALKAAEEKGALGYQASIRIRLADLKGAEGNHRAAIQELETAIDLAQRAGGRRLAAEAGLALSKAQQADNRFDEAAKSADKAIAGARAIQEQLLLPRLLALRAELDLRQRQPKQAVARVTEAADVLDGLLAGVTSPWLRSRLIGAMDDVYATAVRVHIETRSAPAALFSTVERARGRAFSTLLAGTRPPIKTAERRAGERELARLQSQLFLATDTRQRKSLLDRILQKEIDLAPALSDPSRTALRKPVTLATVQARLQTDEVLLEFVSTSDALHCIVATRAATRIARLSANDIGALPELERYTRIIVVPDGPLHQRPVETLSRNGRLLVETHTISYSPSGSLLAALRGRKPTTGIGLLAVASSPAGSASGPVMRGVYDVEPGKLSALPSAAREVQVVADALGLPQSRVLVPPAATEAALKQENLTQYAVLHFAVHGVPSSKFPERSALLLEPGSPNEDGLLQAREVLDLRLNAGLVTLSACETAAGSSYGQEGVASLVRPFLAAGARTVIANLWDIEDAFSLALMKELYRQLAAGRDAGEALRQAKLAMLAEFGPDATPKLWSGVVLFGDPRTTISGGRAAQ
jgi:tetratricopeptide (TPR) repeat protein